MKFAEYLATLPPNTVFRVFRYKHSYTPYEQRECFADQSPYVSSTADFVLIENAFELPDGDLLLEVSPFDGYHEYLKLSEITLERSETDNEEDLK